MRISKVSSIWDIWQNETMVDIDIDVDTPPPPFFSALLFVVEHILTKGNPKIYGLRMDN